MKKSFKQIVSVIIAVFMVTALVPAYGFAADSGNAAQTQPATQADSSVAAEQPQTATAETQAAAPQTAAATADTLKLSVDGKTYTGWSNAMTAAATAKKKVVTLVSNGTLPAGQYVIPEGVTLLVPFDEKATLYTTEPECYLYYWDEPEAYRTLTLDAGAELVVNGALSVSAPHTPVMGYLENGGSPYSAYGQIAMKDGSSITVNHGGSLYAYGYITGDGAVKAKNGSVVYEYFQIMDFRGGSATTYLMDAKYKDENGNKTPYGIFPFSQYYVQNIEVPLTLEYGAREYGYTSIYAAKTVTPVKVGFIGPNDDTLFRVNSGSVTKQYNGKTDRIKVSVNGSASLDSIVVKSGDYTMNSADFVMPVNGNMTIEAASGTLNIAEDIALIPGAELIVAKDALCKLADGSRMFVYDNYHWGKYTNIYGEKFNDVNYAPGRTYTRTEANLIDAKVQVGGTLDAQGGFIYTTGKSTSAYGANICGLESGVIKLKNGKDTYTWQFEYVGDKSVDADYGNYHKINVANAKLRNSGGAYVNTEAGTYTYKDGNWSKGCEHSYVEYKAKEPTCTEPGWEAYKTCSKCGDTTYKKVDALNHDVVQHEGKEATYEVDGWDAYETCTRCDHTTYKRLPALRHIYGDWIVDKQPGCVEDGMQHKDCSECDDQLTEAIPALGHDEVQHEAKAATCVENGWAAYETCSRCDYTTYKEIAAKGHTAGPEATCTAVQICTVCEIELAAATGHKWNTKYTVIKKATTKATGSKAIRCANCNDAKPAVKIAKIRKTTASALIYNGKNRTNNVTVVDFNNKKLVKGKDFTVTYKNAKGNKIVTPKAVGKYNAVVIFKGDYSGMVTKKFNINPQGTTITKLTKNGKKQFTAKWKKKTVQVTGYQIRYSTQKNMKNAKMVTVAKKGTTTRTIKQLKAKKKYWVQIRTYKTVNGVKYCSAWSAKKAVTTR